MRQGGEWEECVQIFCLMVQYQIIEVQTSLVPNRRAKSAFWNSQREDFGIVCQWDGPDGLEGGVDVK